MLKNKYIQILGSIICLFFCSISYAQNEYQDSTFIKSEIIQYLKSKNLLPKTNWKEFHPLNMLTKSLTTQKQNLNPLDASIHFSMDNAYVSRDTNSYARNAPTLYSNLQISTEMKALGIPIQLQANLIGLNGQIDRNLSSLNVHFQPRAFLSAMKTKHIQIPTKDQLLDLTDNQLQFTKQELEAIYQEKKFNVYQQIVSNEQFFVHKQQLKHKVDSLTQSHLLKLDTISNSLKEVKDSLLEKSDSLATLVDTTLLAKYRKALNIILKVERLYQKAWKLRNQKDYRLWAGIKEKTNGYVNEVKAYDKADYVKKELLEKINISKWQKLLLKTKQLDIGQFSLDNSDYTAKHLFLRGINYGYESAHYFGQFSYGTQTRPSLFALSSTSSWLGNLGGRQFLFLQAGVGQKEGNHSQVSLLEVREKDIAGDSLFTFPKFNRVLEWSGQLETKEQLFINTSAAISDLDFSSSSQDLESGPAWTSDKLAANFDLIYEPTDKSLAIGLGYFYTGARFTTLGNPFLLTNRQGISFNVEGHLFNNKISVNTVAKYGKSINETSFDGFKDYQILGEMSAKVGQQSSIRASIMPNIFDQEIYDNQKVRSQSIIYSVQGNFVKEIKNIQAITVVNLTNLRTNFQLLDSAQISSNAYLYIQEMVLLSQRQSINTTLMLGSNDLTQLEVDDLLVQGEYNYNWDKVSISIGGQYIKNPFREQSQYGILGSINTTFSENGLLRFYINYRNSWKQATQESAQLAANLSFYYTIQPKRK